MNWNSIFLAASTAVVIVAAAFFLMTRRYPLDAGPLKWRIARVGAIVVASWDSLLILRLVVLPGPWISAGASIFAGGAILYRAVRPSARDVAKYGLSRTRRINLRLSLTFWLITAGNLLGILAQPSLVVLALLLVFGGLAVLVAVWVFIDINRSSNQPSSLDANQPEP